MMTEQKDDAAGLSREPTLTSSSSLELADREKPTLVERALMEAAEAVANARDFVDGYIDVVDGDYGVPHPNKAMQLAQHLDEAMDLIDAAMNDPAVSALRQPAGVSEEGYRPAIQQIAADIAPELDKAIDAYLYEGMMLGSEQYTELVRVLWDNKVGLLRIAQAVLNRPQESGQPGEVERLRAALALGREAVVESFDHAKSLDDTYLADARLRDIDAALAPRMGKPMEERS